MWCGWSLTSGSYADYVRLLPQNDFMRAVFAQILDPSWKQDLADVKDAIHELAV